MANNPIAFEEAFLRSTAELPTLSSDLRERVLGQAHHEQLLQARRRRAAGMACLAPVFLVAIWNLSAFIVLGFAPLPQAEVASGLEAGKLRGLGAHYDEIGAVADEDPSAAQHSSEYAASPSNLEWDLVDTALRAREKQQPITLDAGSL